MSATITLDDQPELISDDPRILETDNLMTPFRIAKEFRDATAEYGPLISRPLAAAILETTPAQIGTWCDRGRLTDIRLGDGRLVFVSGNEVETLFEERSRGYNPKGGRPPLKKRDIVQLGKQITLK